MPAISLGQRPGGEVIVSPSGSSHFALDSQPSTPEGLVGFTFGPSLFNADRLITAPPSPGLDYIDGGPLSPRLGERVNAFLDHRVRAARSAAADDPAHRALLTQVSELLAQERHEHNATTLRDGLMHALEMPVDECSKKEQEKMLRDEGLKTSWRPAVYLALALLGRIGYGMGPTLLEHQAMPSQPKVPGTVPEGQTGPTPPYAKAAVKPDHLLAGLMVTGAGITVGVAAAGLFVNQARLNNPKRAWTLFGLHLSAIVLIAGHRFLIEWVEYNRPPSKVMMAAIPGIIGTALYAYTVPNSLTAGETRLGLIPLGSLARRAEIALVMGAAGVGLFSVWAMLSAQQGVQPYVRESALILATLLSTTGMSLAFTNAQQYRTLVARGFQHVQRANQQTSSPQSTTPKHGVRRPLALPLDLPRLAQRPGMPPRADTGSGSELPMLPRRSSASTVTVTGVLPRQPPTTGEALTVRRASVSHHLAVAGGTSSGEISPCGAAEISAMPPVQPQDYFMDHSAHGKAC